MSVFDTLKIAGSGLTAQRLRMDIGQQPCQRPDDPHGRGRAVPNPRASYSRLLQARLFRPGRTLLGVARVAIVTPGRGEVRVFDPTHPDADAEGFVAYPDVDVASEMTDIMGAARAYQVNATVATAAKQSALDALEIGR